MKREKELPLIEQICSCGKGTPCCQLSEAEIMTLEPTLKMKGVD
jgi:hypothetical protein